ncbi:hypothetical protein BGZ83_003245, partial [Gryganskiella cystojenkinii]
MSPEALSNRALGDVRHLKGQSQRQICSLCNQAPPLSPSAHIRIKEKIIPEKPQFATIKEARKRQQ